MEPIPLLNESNIGNASTQLNYSIVDLLPQNSSALVRDSKMAFEILKMIYNVINLLADCLHKFYISKQYQYFDPHVGENACQIRAYVFVTLAQKECDNNAIEEHIYFLNSYLDKLKKILNTPITYKNNSHTITELITRHNCYFSVEWQECFLYKSYFLTLFKKLNFQESYISSDEIADFLEVSKKSAKKMIHKYQSHLAMMSCDFIKTIFYDLNINDKNHPNLISSTLSDDDGRMVYPCFFYSKTLFMHMKKTRCTVLLILETIVVANTRKDLLLFDEGAAQGRVLTMSNIPTKDSVCLVVMCSRIAAMPLSTIKLLKELNSYGLYDILLMNMAAHPQFGGSKLISFANQLVPDIAKLTSTEKAIETEFLTLKSNAHKNGFCLDNPSLLLVKHIFMDTISNQINLHRNNNDISVRETVND